MACTLRARRGTELPADARCAGCGTTDRRVLAWAQLEAERVVLCLNDAARVRVVGERAATAADLVWILADVVADRRRSDRRAGTVDRRIHFDRRGVVVRPLGGRRAADTA